MRSLRTAAFACLIGAALATTAALAGESVKLFGYLEYRKGSALIGHSYHRSRRRPAAGIASGTAKRQISSAASNS